MALRARFADVRLPSQRTSLKDAENGAMRSFSDSFTSASELEYHFLLARDLGFLPEQEYRHLDQRVIEVKKMLAGLIKKVEGERHGL